MNGVSIFTQTGKEGLSAFIDFCCGVTGLDRTKAQVLADQAMAYYASNTDRRQELRGRQELERRWYDSVARGQPDYRVYEEDYYLFDIWAGWLLYSRKYLQLMQSSVLPSGKTILQETEGSRVVADLGCGFGYSTAGLKEMYPLAQVYGTNVLGGTQFTVATALGQRRDFLMVGDVHDITQPVELIFASEYFEHWQDPISHLYDVIGSSVQALVVANSFGSTSIGHFPVYGFGSKRVSNRAIGRKFSDALRQLGFEKADTPFWNSRPAYWRRK